MNFQVMPYKSMQNGFTLVEVVAVMVITVTLAAWAMPKMDRAGDIGTGSAANRLVAALQYAQVLAQRQGVDTKVEITSAQIKVTQSGTPVKLSADDYVFELSREVLVENCTNITYKPDGTFVPAAGITCLVKENGETRFIVKIEPTGHAYLVT